MDKILREAIKAAGGIRALARKVGVKHNAILKWRRIPPLRVHQVEKITGIPRSVLRPDVYPPEREGQARAAR
jgi:DNA-binding transcriptional regulator YdaS (Cro superfamily)